MSYETIYEDTQQSVDDVKELQNTTWDSFEESFVSPNPISNVSDSINSLLQEDSEYMQTAREKSAEQFADSGRLESAFWESSGEVAAIDNVLPAAESDVQVDLYNQFQQNEQDTNAYTNTFNSYLQTQEAGNKLIEQDNFSALVAEVNRVNAGYALEQRWYDAQYEIERQRQGAANASDYNSLLHGYDLDNKDTIYSYDERLREQGYEHWVKARELDGKIVQDREYRNLAYSQYDYTKQLSAIAMAEYQEDYQAIVSSNMEPEAKESMVWEIYNEHIARQKELGTWQQVGNNPYSYEDFSMGVGSPAAVGSDVYKTGAWYKGGGVTVESMAGFIDTLDAAFRDELGTKERHAFATAEKVKTIKEVWPQFTDEFPAETEGMKKWFGAVAQSGYLSSSDDAYVQVIDDWWDMVIYLSMPEGQVINPNGSPDDDGNFEKSDYKDYELNTETGDIERRTYTYVINYCTTEPGSGAETCTTDEPRDGDYVGDLAVTVREGYELKATVNQSTGEVSFANTK